MDDIRPLKDIVQIKEGILIWPVLLFILIIAALIFTAVYLMKKKKASSLPPEPPKLPEQTAMEELTALLGMKLIEQGMIKEYYIRLSDIIRKYIEGRYKILALDKTTWELYQEMRENKVKRPDADKIRDFLEDCDFVKFAKYKPDQRHNEEAYEGAKDIVLNSNDKAQMTR